MTGLTNFNISLVVGMFFIVLPALAIIASKKDFSSLPSPKPRDFSAFLAEWARQKGLAYTPQQVSVVSGIYGNRWFSIHTRNAENALEISMRVDNLPRHSLQIFADWLEESGVTAFINRFRIYSSPPGLGESLFDTGSGLREALSRFPSLRARLELACDPLRKDELHYWLLTDLPAGGALDSILDAMGRFCDAYESEQRAMAGLH